MAWRALRQYGRSFGTGFVIGLPIYITITDLGFCIARVDGISMQPSLNPTTKPSDIVLLNRWTARDVFNVKRGDVVSLISPSDPDVKLIKRVIGLEGDVIKTIGYKRRYVSIPKGHCWVEGDHRGKSYDSNKFGPISLGLVNGIATHIVWPPKRWMKIQANIDKDRKPMRRSFNQCTFNDILKSSKESDEVSNNGNSSIKNSNDDGKAKDVVAMKRKFLSDDVFLGNGAVTLWEGEKDPNSSSYLKGTDSDMPLLSKEQNDDLDVALKENLAVGNDIEIVKRSGNDSDDSGNDIWKGNKGNCSEESTEGEHEIVQQSGDLPFVKNNDPSCINGENKSFLVRENVGERICNSIDNTESDSDVLV